MTKELTPKQEAFAQAVASGLTQSDAYRKAYKVSPTTKPMSVNQLASTLMGNDHISSRVKELRERGADNAVLTREAHLEELKRLKGIALELEDIKAAINAEQLRGKVMGHYIERQEVTGKDGAALIPTPIYHIVSE
ncbi:hypothetical protein UFOVP1309_4 [uncultured Caudovirales phage]|uniref:Terminase small subunit n=1 Tax=uncultured Caudovirales phage TaxID=2100421 RepID=A0A6J5RUK9_9CAUD|nr:hypothetical protein UFOVP1309_4 [uncultured Caudovirales phage]